jgi:hypothetical protein
MADSITFSITPEDIAAGQCTNPYSCAAALALRRHFGGAYRVLVSTRVASVFRTREDYIAGESADYTNSPELTAFIQAFDRYPWDPAQFPQPGPGEFALTPWGDDR